MIMKEGNGYMATGNLDEHQKALSENDKKAKQFIKQHTFSHYADYAGSETSRYFSGPRTQSNVNSASLVQKVIVVVVIAMIASITIPIIHVFKNFTSSDTASYLREEISKECGNEESTEVYLSENSFYTTIVVKCGDDYIVGSSSTSYIGANDATNKSYESLRRRDSSHAYVEKYFDTAAIGFNDNTDRITIVLQANDWIDFRTRYYDDLASLVRDIHGKYNEDRCSGIGCNATPVIVVYMTKNDVKKNVKYDLLAEEMLNSNAISPIEIELNERIFIPVSIRLDVEHSIKYGLDRSIDNITRYPTL
jgi:hypothetical protein